MSNSAAQRQHLRKRVVEPAILKVRGQDSAYFCMIRDLSEGGALLRIPPELPIEGEMELTAAQIGLKREVRIAWRDDHSIGVSFR